MDNMCASMVEGTEHFTYTLIMVSIVPYLRTPKNKHFIGHNYRHSGQQVFDMNSEENKQSHHFRLNIANLHSYSKYTKHDMKISIMNTQCIIKNSMSMPTAIPLSIIKECTVIQAKHAPLFCLGICVCYFVMTCTLPIQ